MSPSHAAATPMVARNVGSSVVAVSCDQSLRSEVSPTPMTVRFNQRGRARAAVLDMAVSGLVLYRPTRARRAPKLYGRSGARQRGWGSECANATAWDCMRIRYVDGHVDPRPSLR